MAIELLYAPYPAPFDDLPHNLKVVFEEDAGPVSLLPPDQDLGLAMVARPFDAEATVDLLYPPYPAPFPEDPAGIFTTILGDRATVVASTHGFTSRGGDDPEHTHFPPYLAEGFNFAITLLDAPDPAISGKTSSADLAGNGVIILSDPAGALDQVVQNYAWQGRELRLYRGDNEVAFATWDRVADLTTAGIDYSAREKRIRLRDLQGPLYATALLDRYDGTGGLGGDAAVKGQAKQQVYGPFFNVAPRCIDSVNSVFQWHDRRSLSLAAARDGVSAIIIDGDDPDLATLLAASIPDGHARTCLAYSLIRTKLAPQLGLRLDGKGDAASFGGFTYVQTRGGIARRLATSRGAVALADPRQIEESSFSLLDALQGAPVGFWFDGDGSIGQALDVVMEGCAGAWWVGLDAKMRVWQVAEPDTVADFVLEHPVDIPGELEMLSPADPRWRTRVGYQHNWAPQTAADLGESTSVEQQLYGNEWRFAPSTDEAVRTRYPSARDPEIRGGYEVQANATGEAVRQQQLFGVRREIWTCPAILDPFADVLGKTVEIRGWNRFDFYPARRFRVVGMDAVAGLGRVTLRLWG